MEIENKINNKIETEKNNFFENIIGKTINTSIDIGLKAILPDLIENQIIDIKNALIKNGLKSGIDVAIESAVDLGKSTKGIFTGNFENISQVRTAIGEGGIVDSVSKVLDKTINKTINKGYINDKIGELIKGGKNIILENIRNNIKGEMDIQEIELKKLDENIKKWEACYKNKDFEGMTKAYNKINEQVEKTIPLENILKNVTKVNSIHNLIKNNGKNFNISEIEIKLAEKLIK